MSCMLQKGASMDQTNLSNTSHRSLIRFGVSGDKTLNSCRVPQPIPEQCLLWDISITGFIFQLFVILQLFCGIGPVRLAFPPYALEWSMTLSTVHWWSLFDPLLVGTIDFMLGLNQTCHFWEALVKRHILGIIGTIPLLPNIYKHLTGAIIMRKYTSLHLSVVLMQWCNQYVKINR